MYSVNQSLFSKSNLPAYPILSFAFLCFSTPVYADGHCDSILANARASLDQMSPFTALAEEGDPEASCQVHRLFAQHHEFQRQYAASCSPSFLNPDPAGWAAARDRSQAEAERWCAEAEAFENQPAQTEDQISPGSGSDSFSDDINACFGWSLQDPTQSFSSFNVGVRGRNDCSQTVYWQWVACSRKENVILQGSEFPQRFAGARGALGPGSPYAWEQMSGFTYIEGGGYDFDIKFSFEPITPGYQCR